MKKNEKLFDAIGQIDERYIAEALEPMHQESAGTSDENKAAMPKKGKLFFYRQRRTVAAAAALVICIGAAGIAQWRLHSEEPGPEMAAYDMENLWKESEEIGAFKNTILMVICQTAAKLYHADQTEESETVKLLFRALCMISFEGWDVAGLTPVMVELGKAGRI